jgi:hypothetical protein
VRSVAARFTHCLAVVLLFIQAGGTVSVHAQDSHLKGLTAVWLEVSVWEKTAPASSQILKTADCENYRRMIRTDIEQRLRKAGMRVLTEDPGSGPILSVEVTVRDGEAMVDVTLHETALLERSPSTRVRAATWRGDSQCGDRDLRGLVPLKEYNAYVRTCFAPRTALVVDMFLNSWRAVNPKQL